MVCYEEPQFTNADDVIDRAKKYPGSPQMLIPAGGVMSITYNNSDALETVLAKLVKTRVVPDRGAHYEVVKSGSAYMLVPAEARDSMGAWRAQRSVLDFPITMEAENRTAEELLNTIVGLIGEASKRDIRLGWDPGPPRPDPPKYELSAQSEPGRSVLLRALAAIAPQTGPAAWSLLYTPDDGYLVMNLTGVPHQITPTPVLQPSQPAEQPPSSLIQP
jgi:hypothetical protein